MSHLLFYRVTLALQAQLMLKHSHECPWSQGPRREGSTVPTSPGPVPTAAHISGVGMSARFCCFLVTVAHFKCHDTREAAKSPTLAASIFWDTHVRFHSEGTFKDNPHTLPSVAQNETWVSQVTCPLKTRQYARAIFSVRNTVGRGWVSCLSEMLRPRSAD